MTGQSYVCEEISAWVAYRQQARIHLAIILEESFTPHKSFALYLPT